MRKKRRPPPQYFVILVLIVSLLIVIPIPSGALSSQHRVEDLATNWSEDVPLSNLTDNRSAYSPSSTVNNTNIHVIYEPGYYTRSLDSGRTWSERKYIPTYGTSGIAPKIAVNEDLLHVVYEKVPGAEVYYKRSLDNGDSWGSDVLLSEDDGKMSWNPSIAVENDNVHVVWQDGKDYGEAWCEIYYKRSTTNGESWDDGQENANAIRRLTNDSAESEIPIITVNGSNIHVFWADKRSGGWEAWYVRSEDNGATWSQNKNITPIDNINSFPIDAVIDGNKIYLVGEDIIWGTPDYYAIWFMKSEDGGISWSLPTKIVDQAVTGYACADPSIAINDSYIFVVWTDCRNSATTELYYKYSNNYGTTWSPDIRLTYCDGASGYSQIAIVNNTLHIVWQDTRTNTPEVFYKRSPGFASNISLIANPTNLPADGISTSIITATVTNKTGSPIQGLNVNFGIENGGGTLLQSSNITDSNGIATATFVAGTVAGNVIINVSCDGIWNKTSITLLPSRITEIKIVPEGPINLYANETRQFTAVAYDQYENINVSWTPYWHVDGNIGIINETGFFTATKKGSGAVNHTDNITGVYNVSIVNILNSMPMIESVSNQTAYEGRLFTLQVNASDPDKDNLTFSDNSTLFDINSTTGLISFTPSYDSAEVYLINITASDDEELAWQAFKLEIINKNRAPVLEWIENQTAYEGQLFTLQINATDPDDDALTFSDNSTLFDINSTTGLISFTPNYTSAGDYQVNITVTDGEDIVWKTFKLTINNVNRAPTIESIENQTAHEGQLFTLQVNATGPDIDTLTFSDNSTLFDISSTTGLISFTPSYDAAGVYLINISVTDGEDFVWQTFKLEIINVNRAPIATISSPLNNSKFTTDDNINFGAIGSYDPDNDNLTYTWTTSTDGNIENAKTFSTKLSAGTHVITLTISDGTNISTEQITITVESPPPQPGWRFIPGDGAITISVICAVIAVIMILHKLKKIR